MQTSPEIRQKESSGYVSPTGFSLSASNMSKRVYIDGCTHVKRLHATRKTLVKVSLARAHDFHKVTRTDARTCVLIRPRC